MLVVRLRDEWEVASRERQTAEERVVLVLYDVCVSRFALADDRHVGVATDRGIVLIGDAPPQHASDRDVESMFQLNVRPDSSDHVGLVKDAGDAFVDMVTDASEKKTRTLMFGDVDSCE